ncbi:MAG: hypothetical protein ACFFG0_47620 [Candidatus Thorarchaeota archaeon]
MRNNLRLIFAHACWDQTESLRALQCGFVNENIESGVLYSQILDIEEALRKFICICGTCRSLENDVTYFPSLKAWHCVECERRKVIWFPHPP